jgi:hypothetical protein
MCLLCGTHCVYIPEDSILHSHRRENLKSYIIVIIIIIIVNVFSMFTVICLLHSQIPNRYLRNLVLYCIWLVNNDLADKRGL